MKEKQVTAEELGPTGKFPDGKISEDDEGEFNLGVAVDPITDLVVVNFGVPIKWFAIDPKGARKLAGALIKKAREAEQQEELKTEAAVETALMEDPN